MRLTPTQQTEVCIALRLLARAHQVDEFKLGAIAMERLADAFEIATAIDLVDVDVDVELEAQ